ncbi:MAG TPA: 50S ribosomal protein L24 [Dehalococcoidia bacterium]|nr:50S ribosomal protein L24 [Dehalococcoidia bacterium]
MKIRKNDTVLVIAGKDKGKRGKVRQALPKEDKIIVDGINMIKRHSRARGAARQAGIIELEAPLHVSNVMLVCNKCNKPTLVGLRFLDDGKKARICRSCYEVID